VLRLHTQPSSSCEPLSPALLLTLLIIDPSTGIMPRGQNHKLCIHEKHHQARYELQSHKRVQPTAVMEEFPSTSSLLEDNSQSSSATGSNSTSQGSLEAPSTTSTFSTTSDTTSDVEDTSQDEEDSGSSNVSSSTENTYRDTLNSMTSLLEQFLLHKYKIKQPIMKKTC